LRETVRVCNERINFIGERRQIVAFYRAAFFKKMIGIAFFLSGNRIDNDENQVFRRFFLFQCVFFAHRGFVFRFGKNRVNRNA
jgi:hypothetical protein